jgi:hypothetical protein
MREFRHLLLLALLCSGCPGKRDAKPSTPSRCERFGQSCEFSPGKLGSCVERTNCTSGNCLTCQSQH